MHLRERYVGNSPLIKSNSCHPVIFFHIRSRYKMFLKHVFTWVKYVTPQWHKFKNCLDLIPGNEAVVYM